jgi:NAD-dependent deacetylase
VDASALAALIRANQPCVVLTGAGVSTESGIPDFRSPTGIWADFDPLEYASLPAFRADPEKVWSFYKPRIAMLTAAEPNAAHRALAELERRGLVEAVVTQNIDLLHERAGPAGAVERAFELARRAGLLLVVGSSLEVHPVAALPEETLLAGGRLAIVNKGSTPYDDRADLKLEGNAGEILGAVVEGGV